MDRTAENRKRLPLRSSRCSPAAADHSRGSNTILKGITALIVGWMAAVLAMPVVAGASAGDDMALRKALRSGGHILLLRHAIAPGTGDPDRFKLGDCATQRNLSQEGRDQALRIGERLRDYGVSDARVFTSQWCRAAETARLLKLGAVSELPALNSFFGQPHRGEAQTASLRQWLAQQDLQRPVVLVTHQVNITALSGIYPASGEIVVMRRNREGRLAVVGRLRP